MAKLIASNDGSVDVAFESMADSPRPGLKRLRIMLGAADDRKVADIHWAQDPPGIQWDAHSYPTDFIMVYLHGSQKVGEEWFREGDARIVKAGDVTGPMEAGPEGSMALVIFADSVPPLEATFVKRSGSDDEPQTNYYQHARVPGQ
jgi:hypothetical protein